MIFKSWMILPLTIFLLGGCAKENQPSSVPLTVKTGSTSDCLDHFHSRLSEFFEGTLSATQIAQFWDCTSSAVDEYERLTTPPDASDRYSKIAVRRFLEDYFIKDTISDQLLNAFMEVKRVILGGTTDGLTREELDLLRDFISEVKSASLDVQPYMPILMHKVPHASDAEIEQATGALDRALSRLGIWLVHRHENYTDAEMRDLIVGLGQWGLFSPQASSTAGKILDLFPNVKGLLIAGHPHEIAGTEWLEVTTAVSKAFYVYLSASYGLHDGLNAALNSESLPESLNSFVQVLAGGVQNHPNGTVADSEWQALFNKVETTGWLPSGVTASTLQNAWLWADCRLLSAQATCAGDLGPAQIGVLAAHLSNWRALLQYSSDGRLDSSLKQRFWTILNQTPPMSWDASGRLLFPIPAHSAWQPADVHRMVWPYVILDWVKSSYVPSDAQAIDESQAVTIAKEVLPVLQGFGWLTHTQTSIGKKLVREGDTFTLSGNGDGELDLGEATRYLVFVASAYQAATTWLERAQLQCGSHSLDCVHSVALTPEVMSPMPRLSNVMEAQGPDAFINFMNAAEVTSLGTNESGEVKTADLLQVWMVFEYIETFEARFDVDHSETIDLAEARQAFNIYGPTLSRLLHQPTDSLYPFFTFLMKYGDNPYTMFGGQIAYNNWLWHSDSWSFSADRLTLVHILEQLSKF